MPAQPVTSALAARPVAAVREQRMAGPERLVRSGCVYLCGTKSAISLCILFSIVAMLSLRPQFSDLCHKDFSPCYLIKI